MKVSVLLSTRNRCDKLRLFLEGMKANAAEGMTSIEVLVMDNGSTDATKRVVAEYIALENPVVRYLSEATPGKSRALNIAFREASGDIIAFTDDDCIPAPNWVDCIVKEFDSDPELAVLGGRVDLYDKMDVQQAVLISDQRVHVTSAREICANPTIIGANMAFRSTALKAIRGFDPSLGPGTKCRAAEDLDLLYRSLKNDLRIAYSPDVIVAHNHGRRSDSDEDQTSYAYAVGRGAFYFKYLLRLDIRIARLACREVLNIAKTLTKSAITRKQSPYHRLIFPAIFVGGIEYCRAQFSWKRLPIARAN